MKNLTLLACIILLAIKTNAQDSSAAINTTWIGYALDTSLTFWQIANTCDSQFNAAGYPAYGTTETSDSGADLDGSSFYSYELWKNFYATRLDLATGRPHSFAADALAFLSGSAASTNCGGTSPIQSNPGWQFIGPQNIYSTSEKTNENALHMHLGQINGVVVNTTNPTNIYVTDSWGGLWETTNAPAAGGTTSPTWTCLSDHLPAMAGIGINNLCVDFTGSTNALYCIVGEPSNAFAMPYSAEDFTHTVGIFYSLDDGATFNQMDISSIPYLLTDPILAMQLWPGNTSVQKYLFVLTQFEIWRVDITNPSSPIWSIMFSAYINVPSDANTSRFLGFSSLAFLPSSSSSTPYDYTVMYVATNGNSELGVYEAMPEMFRIADATTCGWPCILTSVPITQTDYLQGNGNFSVSGAINSWFKSGWIPPSGIGISYVECPSPQPPIPYGTGVQSIETPVAGSYFDNITYTISFTLTLPPNTETDVVLKDAADANQGGPDWGTGITPTPSSVGAYSVNFGVGPGYNSDGSSPVAGYYVNTGSVTATVTVNAAAVTVTHFVDRLEFGAYQLTPYTTTPGYVTLSKVQIIEPYQIAIYGLTTTSALPQNVFCCTIPAPPALYIPDTLRKIWDPGSTPMISVGMPLGTLSTSNISNMQVSSTNTNLIYVYDDQAEAQEVNKIDITDPTAPVITSDGPACYNLHPDSRCMFLVPNSSGPDNLYVGDDGGIAEGVYGGPWQSLNGTGLTTSRLVDIGTSEHTGEIGIAATDNGIMLTNANDYSHWTFYFVGDGAQAKFGKRYETRNVLFIGSSSDSRFDQLSVAYLGGTPTISATSIYSVSYTYPALPATTIYAPPLAKLVTTYNDEYFGTGGGGIYDILFASSGGYNYLSFISLTTGSFTPTWLSPGTRKPVQPMICPSRNMI